MRLIEKAGLAEMAISGNRRQKCQKNLDAAMDRPFRCAVQTIIAGRPDGVGVVEGLAKTRGLCPLSRDA